MQFTVYSKPNCPFCDQAKALLEAKGESFRVVHLDVGQPKVEDQVYISRDELIAKIPTARTMPQITLESPTSSTHIGGVAELRSRLMSAAA